MERLRLRLGISAEVQRNEKDKWIGCTENVRYMDTCICVYIYNIYIIYIYIYMYIGIYFDIYIYRERNLIPAIFFIGETCWRFGAVFIDFQRVPPS